MTGPIVSVQVPPGSGSVVLTGERIGTTTVTVTVDDGYNTNPPIQASFSVSVGAPQPPSWGLLTNEIVTAFNTPITITLPIIPGFTPLSNLVFSSTIQTDVVSSVVFTNNGTNATATFNVVTNADGTELVSLTMFDGYTSVTLQPTVNVLPPTAPTIGTIATQLIQVAGSTNVALPITPGLVPLAQLTVTATPVNSTIVTAVVSADKTSLLLTAGNIGSTTVTVSVSDGYNKPMPTTFTVNVFQPQPPTWGFVTNFIDVPYNSAPVTITLPITAGYVPLSGLSFSLEHREQRSRGDHLCHEWHGQQHGVHGDHQYHTRYRWYRAHHSLRV